MTTMMILMMTDATAGMAAVVGAWTCVGADTLSGLHVHLAQSKGLTVVVGEAEVSTAISHGDATRAGARSAAVVNGGIRNTSQSKVSASPLVIDIARPSLRASQR